VVRDLDAFTHFRQVGDIFTVLGQLKLSRVDRLALRLAIALAVAFGMVGVSAEPARLFEPVPPWRSLRGVAAEAASMADLSGDQVVFRELVRMNEQAIGAPLDISVEGRERKAWLVDAYEREDKSGTSYLYATDFASDGEPGLLSVFTTFADGRPAYAYVVVDGKGYFVSPTGDGSHVITRTLYGETREKAPWSEPRASSARPAMRMNLASNAFAPVSQQQRRRACCTFLNRVQISVLVNVGPENPYGLTDKAKVQARVTHYFDRMNAAFRNSGESNYIYFREINYIAFSDGIPSDGYLEWAQDSPEVEAIRSRLQAAGTLLLVGRFVQPKAVLLAPGALLKPQWRIMVAGGYIQDDLDEAPTNMHEIGHFFGKDHQLKWSREGQQGLPPSPLPRYGWDSCERLEHCIMAYADCGRAMRTVEIFSGYRAQKLGYPVNLGTQNSVAVSNMVGYELAKPWP
jgi:hypothetical protein